MVQLARAVTGNVVEFFFLFFLARQTFLTAAVCFIARVLGGGFDEPFDVCTVWVERTVNVREDLIYTRYRAIVLRFFYRPRALPGTLFFAKRGKRIFAPRLFVAFVAYSCRCGDFFWSTVFSFCPPRSSTSSYRCLDLLKMKIRTHRSE